MFVIWDDELNIVFILQFIQFYIPLFFKLCYFIQLSHSVLHPNDCDACQVLNLTLSKKNSTTTGLVLGQYSWYSESLQDGEFRVKTLMGERHFPSPHPSKTGHGPHPDSCMIGTEVLSHRSRGWRMALTTQPHLVPSIGTCIAISLLPLSLHGMS